MATQPCILELWIDGHKCDEVKCFGTADIERNRQALIPIWFETLIQGHYYEFWAVYRPDTKNTK